MTKKSKTFKQLIAVLSIVTVAQLSFGSISFADNLNSPQGTSGDISVQILPVAKERAFAALVCNNGTDPIIGFTLDISATNYNFNNKLALPAGLAGSNPTNSGTFNGQTGAWNGTINPAGFNNPGDLKECVAIGLLGTPSGNIGDTISISTTILSSTLGDSTANIDTDSSNDSSAYTTAPIILDPDLTLSTRLLTTGNITTGSSVSYSLDVTNGGAGNYVLAGSQTPFGVYFILPEGTSFVDVTDGDLTDNITSNPSDCGEVTNDVSQMLPAFAGYHSALIGCQLTVASGIVAPGESFKLNFNMTSSGAFSTGSTQAVAIMVADDIDNILLQLAMYTPSTDPFNVANNNVSTLTYDGNDLAVNVNPCNGTSTVVNVNDACFKVTFNKQIVDEEFTQSDLVLTGGGSIYYFEKTGANEWTVKINDLPLGQNIALSLDLESVQDYSAVLNRAEVLGINIVRYENVVADTPVANGGATGSAPSVGAAGSLPSTGSSSIIWQFAFAIMLLGFSLLNISKRKSLVSMQTKQQH